VAQRNLDVIRVQPLRELPLGVKGDRLVVLSDQVPEWHRLPDRHVHHLVEGRHASPQSVFHSRPDQVDLGREVVDEVVL